MPLSKFELKTKRSFSITSYLLLTIKYYKMKKKNFIYGLVMATVLFTACTDDADDSNNFANLQADIETITNNLTEVHGVSPTSLIRAKMRPVISLATDSPSILMEVWWPITEALPKRALGPFQLTMIPTMTI